jgi:hypothetical protein
MIFPPRGGCLPSSEGCSSEPNILLHRSIIRDKKMAAITCSHLKMDQQIQNNNHTCPFCNEVMWILSWNDGNSQGKMKEINVEMSSTIRNEHLDGEVHKAVENLGEG